MADDPYFIGMGDLYAADRDQDTGLPGPLTALGEAPEFELSIENTRVTNMNTSGPIARQDASIVISQAAKVKMVLKKSTAQNLAMFVFGEVVAEAGGSFTGETFPTVAAGELHRLPNGRANVSSLVLTDSTAVTPLVLTLGTHYTVDLKSGLVTFLSITGRVQPFKAAGTEAAHSSVALLNQRVAEKYIFFRGTNLGDDDKVFNVELYRVSLDAATLVKFKSMDFNTYEINAEILEDRTKGIDPEFGYYGRIQLVE